MIKIFKNDNIEYCQYDDENAYRPVVTELDNTVCFGYTQQDVLIICLNEPFPGNSNYSANHPIWKCNVGNYKTSFDAWTDENILRKAIRNWFYMLCMNELMVEFNPGNQTQKLLDSLYISYNKRWGKALLEKDNITIAQYVLSQFTIAELAQSYVENQEDAIH